MVLSVRSATLASSSNICDTIYVSFFKLELILFIHCLFCVQACFPRPVRSSTTSSSAVCIKHLISYPFHRSQWCSRSRLHAWTAGDGPRQHQPHRSRILACAACILWYLRLPKLQPFQCALMHIAPDFPEENVALNVTAAQPSAAGQAPVLDAARLARPHTIRRPALDALQGTPMPITPDSQPYIRTQSTYHHYICQSRDGTPHGWGATRTGSEQSKVYIGQFDHGYKGGYGILYVIHILFVACFHILVVAVAYC